MLTGPRDLSLQERIRTASELYVTRLAEQGTTDRLSKDVHEEEVVTLLKFWPNWSSLLLFAVLDMLDQMSLLGVDHRRYLVSRILPLARSVFFPLHMTTCVFGACEEHFRINLAGSWWLGDVSDFHTCARQLVFRVVLPESFYDALSIEPAVITALAHGLNDLVPPVMISCAMELLEKQQTFDLAWEMYINPRAVILPAHYKSATELMLHLQFLLDEGCELTGRHVCSLSSSPSENDVLLDKMGCFIEKNLSHDDLSHSTSCNMHSSNNNIASHLTDWEKLDHRGPYIIEIMVPILRDRGVDFGKFMNLTAKHSALSAILHVYKMGLLPGYRTSTPSIYD